MTMLAQNAGCAVDGLWLDVSNQPSWSGRAISFTGNYQAYNAAGNDVYKAHTTLRRVNLTALGIVTGDALYLGAGNSAKQSIASVVVTDLSVTGFGNCIHLHASGTGWINGNIFSGISCIYSAVGLNLDNRGSDTIEGNVFTGFSFQDGPGTTAGVAALATGIVRYNEMFGAIIWDTTSVPPISLAASHVYNNVFMGRFDGTSNDPSHMNNFLDPLHGVWAAPSMKTQSIQYGSAPGYPVTLAPAVGAPYDVLVPNQAGTANVLALDNAGNLSLGGSVAPGGGTRVVYRCRAAGALPAGTLTINSSECGASVDTGLRTK